jgi:hypothetical protein
VYGRRSAPAVRRIGFRDIVRHWPEWRSRVRSLSARRGLDFLVEWLPRHHPELMADVWGLCRRRGLARGATPEDWGLVRWVPPAPSCDEFLANLASLGEELLLVR